ncbi:response regulator [Salinarimonas sp. NSM]|uniref:response regulator n=1 Tax=Salinarimonas sp. NSM TaxID=3458003 RepID=UPI004035D3D3
MLEILRQLFAPESLAPHGMCLTWRPELIYAHVVSDALIGAAYFSIPLALGAFVVKRRDVTFGWVFWCFALFILACGATHFFSIWTLWNPDYGVQAVLKGFTALVSLATAAILWPLLPAALALPSPKQLAAANASLEARIAERDAALAALRREIAEREKAEETLRQVQKMEAVGQLTGGVAHDFNNLLAATLSSLELLAKRVPEDDAKARRYLENALTATERGAALTHRLLAFARRQALAPTTLDIAGLVSGMMDLLRRSLGPMIDVETRFPDALPPVRVDANQLELALLNLAVNARDAMPEGGRLVVSASETTVAEDDPAGLTPGRYVRITVRDGGCGMDAQTLARATEPFFTTKEIGKGTGLGLSMVHGLAAQSGGTLRLASEPGVGTEAVILLPAADAADIVPASAPEAIEGPLQPLSILLVDDDPLVLAGTRDLLAEAGHRVVAVASAAEALARIETDDGFDVVLSDLAMPGMTGVALAQTLRERRPDLPVVLLTGFGEAAGDWPRLAKPFHADELARTLAPIAHARAERG